MSLRTPNYVTNEPILVKCGSSDLKTIPVGSFVRPIDLAYVPKHVLEDPKWERFDKEKEVFIFCRYGIVAVRKDSIRESV